MMHRVIDQEVMEHEMEEVEEWLKERGEVQDEEIARDATRQALQAPQTERGTLHLFGGAGTLADTLRLTEPRLGLEALWRS